MRSERYRAAVKGGAATRFIFEVPPGDYSVCVECKGYERQSRLVTLRAGERRTDEMALRWEPIAGRGREGKGGEATLVDARLREFGQARNQGFESFPFDGRARALEQKRRMVDPEVINAPLEGVGNFVFVSHTKKPVRAGGRYGGEQGRRNRG
jgi:hypothetical protein